MSDFTVFLVTSSFDDTVFSVFLLSSESEDETFPLFLFVLVDVVFCLISEFIVLLDEFCFPLELLLEFTVFLLFEFVFSSLVVVVGTSKSSLVVVSNESIVEFVLLVFVDELLSFNSLPECLLQAVGAVPIKKYSL